MGPLAYPQGVYKGLPLPVLRTLRIHQYNSTEPLLTRAYCTVLRHPTITLTAKIMPIGAWDVKLCEALKFNGIKGTRQIAMRRNDESACSTSSRNRLSALIRFSSQSLVYLCWETLKWDVFLYPKYLTSIQHPLK